MSGILSLVSGLLSGVWFSIRYPVFCLVRFFLFFSLLVYRVSGILSGVQFFSSVRFSTWGLVLFPISRFCPVLCRLSWKRVSCFPIELSSFFLWKSKKCDFLKYPNNENLSKKNFIRRSQLRKYFSVLYTTFKR